MQEKDEVLFRDNDLVKYVQKYSKKREHRPKKDREVFLSTRRRRGGQGRKSGTSVT